MRLDRGGHKDFIERLNRLEDRASHLSVPSAFKPQVYALRLHIDMVRHQARSRFRTSSHEKALRISGEPCEHLFKVNLP
jgi:hypothetical protein